MYEGGFFVRYVCVQLKCGIVVIGAVSKEWCVSEKPTAADVAVRRRYRYARTLTLEAAAALLFPPLGRAASPTCARARPAPRV